MSGKSLLDDDNLVILLDACAVINFAACRRMSDILGVISGQVGIVEPVYRETLFVRRGGTGDDACESEAIDLSSLVVKGTIKIVPPASDEELETFVDLTLQLGDGEAMTIALALHRDHAIVTDDRVAIRATNDQLPVLSSLELIKAWVDRNDVPPPITKTILTDLRQRGSYLPARTHPLKPWWDRFMVETP